MSRCFPYSQNGASIEALINPIKLQKEKSEKSKAKAERKEEKRAKKEQKQKEKEKRKDEEKRAVQKSLTVDSTKAVIKTTTTELTTEQRERSDLTEEHGQPISSQQPSYSSDSTQNTQNSNKRKRDDAVLPDGAGGQGKQIKIRLLKKPRGPEPSKETVFPNVGRVETPVRVLNSGQGSGVVGKNVVTSNGRNLVPITSGRENIAPQARQFSQTMSGPSIEIPRTKGNELQRQHVGMKQTAPSSVRPVPRNHLKQEVPSSHFNKTEVLPVPSQSRQNDVKLGQFSRQQHPVPSQGRPVVSQSRMELEMPKPSSHVKTGPSVYQGEKSLLPKKTGPSVSRRIDVQGPWYGVQQVSPSSGTQVLPPSTLEREIPRPSMNVQTGTSVSRRIDVQGPRYVGQQPVPSSGILNVPTSHLPHENITSASVLGKRSITEMTVPGVNGSARSPMGVPQKVGPTISEKGKEVAVVEVPQKAGPTRLEKKMTKKNSKYEKLIGSWVPPVLAPCGGGGEDEDWLSKKGRTVKSCSKDVDTRELAAPSLWQPCARFLVDADVYAMPYTVPF